MKHKPIFLNACNSKSVTIELSIACSGNDLNRALLEGEVEPEGIDAHTMAVHPSTRHRRFVRHGDFDVSELSLATLLSAHSQPGEYPFTAIPAFPKKKFRHSYFYKHKGSDVESPADLTGKKVGISSWQTTANVWMRGISQEHYGLDLESVTWYRRKADDIAMSVPDRFDVRMIPRDEGKSVAKRDNLERYFFEGKVDAAMDPSGSLFDAVVDSDSVEFMFEDPLQEEKKYFAKTGVHPPMHIVAVRNEVLEDHPWVAVNVYDAFRRSRDRCLERNVVDSLTWSHLYRLQEEEALASGRWEYGLTERNRRSLEKLIEYAHDQGLIPREYSAEELFFESTLEEVGL